jgi:hypothetical protein
VADLILSSINITVSIGEISFIVETVGDIFQIKHYPQTIGKNAHDVTIKIHARLVQTREKLFIFVKTVKEISENT